MIRTVRHKLGDAIEWLAVEAHSRLFNLAEKVHGDWDWEDPSTDFPEFPEFPGLTEVAKLIVAWVPNEDWTLSETAGLAWAKWWLGDSRWLLDRPQGLIVPADLGDGFEKVTLVGGQEILAHTAERCDGLPCPIHRPSEHHMADWPQHWRDDRRIMERTCPHGVGHPDPDDRTDDTVHGCDGCCTPPPSNILGFPVVVDPDLDGLAHWRISSWQEGDDDVWS